MIVNLLKYKIDIIIINLKIIFLEINDGMNL